MIPSTIAMPRLQACDRLNAIHILRTVLYQTKEHQHLKGIVCTKRQMKLLDHDDLAITSATRLLLVLPEAVLSQFFRPINAAY